MSDRIDWRAIAGWSTVVAIQVGAVIYDWMKRRNVRDQNEERREILMRLETMQVEMRGFRFWFKCDYCTYGGWLIRHDRHFVVQQPLPRNGNWDEWAEEEPLSVLMAIECPLTYMPVGWVSLRRYSLIDSSIYVDIARISFDRNRWFLIQCLHLDERTVVVFFESMHEYRLILVVINLQHRSQWQIDIASPPQMATVMHVARGGNRLRIVSRCDPLEEWGRSPEFVTIDYELIRRSNNDPSRLVAVEVSHQSIIFPRHKVGYSRRIFSDLPGIHFLDGLNGASDLVISFDGRADLHAWPLDEWEQEFQVSNFGRRLLSVDNDFRAISHGRFRVDYHLLHKYVFGVLNIGAFCEIFFQRALSVPSLQRLAAESIIRANRNADFSTFESEIGIDMFDGIIRDQDKPILTTTLP